VLSRKSYSSEIAHAMNYIKVNLFRCLALILIIFPLLLSCKKVIVKDITFPIEKKLVSDSFIVPPVIYASHPGLVITGENLVIIETEAERIFSIFNLPDCKYIGGFGVLGRGPEEFNEINPYSATATDKGIRIFDYEKGVLEIDMTDFPTNVSSRNVFKFPVILQFLNSPFQMNDSIICGIPYPQVEIINGQPEFKISNKPYIKINTNSNEIDYFGSYPKLYSKKYSDNYWIIYLNMTVVKPDEGKFVSVGYFIKSLNIYNNDGTLSKELIMRAPDDLLGEESINPVASLYYDAIKATNKYIYAICEDTQQDKVLDNLPNLEVWDWNGNPITLFKLDRPVAAFEVTDDDKKIYFIDRKTQDRIFTYDLDGFLK
jgi:hypothetical protein